MLQVPAPIIVVRDVTNDDEFVYEVANAVTTAIGYDGENASVIVYAVGYALHRRLVLYTSIGSRIIQMNRTYKVNQHIEEAREIIHTLLSYKPLTLLANTNR